MSTYRLSSRQVTLGSRGFLAIGGVGSFLGALCAPRIGRWWGYGRTLLIMGIVVAPFGLLLPLVGRGSGLWFAAAGWLVITVKSGVDNVIAVSFRQRATPDELLGRMNATFRFLLTGALALGAGLAGLVGQYAGVPAALWLAAIGIALVWLPIACSPLRRMRDLPE